MNINGHCNMLKQVKYMIQHNIYKEKTVLQCYKMLNFAN